MNHDDLGLTEEEITDLPPRLYRRLQQEQGLVLPPPPKNTPSTKSLKLYFPDYTHRLDPNFDSKERAR